ncbi:39S ribosomal protein L55, mitochondrial isoform X1 [Mirounga leonina]|uniref:39S ribosomal protein L55, mitochondrial isoform X1 n=2 Tax=Mirounga leonina TaxID=9715 RepID=UPI00156BDD14|nr:39S ribosomal protein L55, mitochondrial isoform X1 [Mirounga leonina]
MTSRRCPWRTGRWVGRDRVLGAGPFPSRLANGGRDPGTRRCSGAQAGGQAFGVQRPGSSRRRPQRRRLPGSRRLVAVALSLGGHRSGRTLGQQLTPRLHVPQGPSGGMATMGRLLGSCSPAWLWVLGEGHAFRLFPLELPPSCPSLTPWPPRDEKYGVIAALTQNLLRQHVLTGSAPARRGLHTSSRQADSSRAWLTRVHRQAYARLYPVLLVKQDGSTVHIRYREPRRVLEMPVDLDTLSPEERRTRLRKRETQLQKKKEEKPELSDDFDEERYKRFWTKK